MGGNDVEIQGVKRGRGLQNKKGRDKSEMTQRTLSCKKKTTHGQEGIKRQYPLSLLLTVEKKKSWHKRKRKKAYRVAQATSPFLKRLMSPLNHWRKKDSKQPPEGRKEKSCPQGATATRGEEGIFDGPAKKRRRAD